MGAANHFFSLFKIFQQRPTLLLLFFFHNNEIIIIKINNSM